METSAPSSYNSTPYRILISGGGTGGHIFPAIAIANALIDRFPHAQILFVGAEGRMEMQRVPDAGYRIVGLPVAGLERHKLWRNVGVLAKLYRSMRKAREIIADFKPQLAIGVGGYASAPIIIAAQRAGVPTMLQEQNGYAGLTNKLLARNARAICVAYEGMERFFPKSKIYLTGNPVRKNLQHTADLKSEARLKFDLQPDHPTILVTGGSLGARTINQSIAEAMPLLDKEGIQVIWQTGRYYYDTYKDYAERYKHVRIMPFISDMDAAYSASDLMVSRAGACTLSELQIVGKPAILIPSPNVAEDHQRHNAEALTSHNAAVMILDVDAVAQLGNTIVELIHDRSRRSTLARNLKEMAQLNSDERIVDIAEQILIGR